MSSNKIYRIKFGSRQIQYQLQFAHRKTLGIKVYPDCTVRVIAPPGADLEKVGLRVKGKAPWIIKQQDDFLSYHPLTPPRKYINGETHLYLGRQHRLTILRSNQDDITMTKGRIVVRTKRQEDVKKLVMKWYKEKSVEYFTKVLEKQFAKFESQIERRPTLQVMAMKTRWGSCTAKGKIILNPELIKAPKASIEYVIVHELCHLIQRNHTKSFYSLQARMMPDWKKWKERLEKTL